LDLNQPVLLRREVGGTFFSAPGPSPRRPCWRSWRRDKPVTRSWQTRAGSFSIGDFWFSIWRTRGNP